MGGGRKSRKRKHAQTADTAVAAEGMFTTPDGRELSASVEKFWHRRHRLFWRFDEGIEIDEVGLYSVTPENLAEYTATRIAQLYNGGAAEAGYGRLCVVDACCGVGGNAIKFAAWCEHVLAIEMDPCRLEMARNNAQIYSVDDRIEFVLADFFAVAPMLAADVVFVSPPWGGVDYTAAPVFDLDALPFHTTREWLDAARRIAASVVMFMPRNCDPRQLAALCPGVPCDIELNYSDGFLVAITAYYGDIARIRRSEPRVLAPAEEGVREMPEAAAESAYALRSLGRCEQQLAEDAFYEPLDAQQVRRLVNMERLVSELQGVDGRPARGSDLAQRVAAVKRQIGPWVERKNAIVAAAAHKSSSSGSSSGSSGVEERQRTGECVAADTGASEGKSGNNGGGSAAKTGQPESLAAKRQAERLLKSQRATHGELTLELAAMAGVLKTNSRALGELVAGDRGLVEETAAALERNVAGVGSQGSRVNAYRRRAWGTTGMTWLAVAVVVSVFLVLVLFMKIAPKRS
ncbi:Trimethylguanosine synthase [Coemansia biformis]|uniref:Trimethylguanosine synthase n=1 Tax=Coemansia biformis TaxID=1286918 RepID=A0A9W7YHF8_9FUNG|nr:Trimethylguanosine synthase [Coemansia biformis]